MGGGGASDELSYQMIDQFDKSIAPTKASQFNANWSAYYQSIYRCNVLLKNIANVNWGTDASLKTQYEAEARFLRAYYYFDLVRLFEKVPLITEPSSAQIPQAEPSATYAQIMDWTATVSENWCTLSVTSGGKGNTGLKILATANTTALVRRATITITAGSLTKQISVKQQPSDYIGFTQNKFDIATAGADFSVGITSTSANYSYSIKADWITLKSTSDDKTSQVFTVAENNSILSRTGFIAYQAGSYKDTVIVTQAGKNAYIAPDETGMVNFMRTAINEQRKYRGLEPISATDFLRLMREKKELVEMDNSLTNRSVNEGFSGGEKKRNEIFQMAMPYPLVPTHRVFASAGKTE